MCSDVYKYRVVMCSDVYKYRVVMCSNVYKYRVVMYSGAYKYRVVMFINIMLWCVIMFINIVLWCVVMFNLFLNRTKIVGSKTQTHFLHTTLLHSKLFQCICIVTPVTFVISARLSVCLRIYQCGSQWKHFRDIVYWGILWKPVEIFQIGLLLRTNTGHITGRPRGGVLLLPATLNHQKSALFECYLSGCTVAEV
jgi:hypothetical protein